VQPYDRIFNDIIDRTYSMFEGMTPTRWDYDPEKAWPQNEKPNLTDRNNIAVEIGGALAGGLNYNCPTGDPEEEVEDCILLYGPDVKGLKNGDPFGRITVVKMSDEGLDERGLFNQIMDINLLKHHVQPKGFTLDQIQAQKFEIVRLDKSVVNEGISFENIGANFISAYKQHPAVLGVTEIFITDSTFDFDVMAAVCKKAKTALLGLRARCINPGNFR